MKTMQRNARTLTAILALATGAATLTRAAPADDRLWATRVKCELQTAGGTSLQDLTWQQGTTPLLSLDQYRSGKSVDATNSVTAIVRFGPSATNQTYFVSVTNYATVGNGYLVQMPTVGTNAAGWWYTAYFEIAGKRYWTGNGRLDIEATTSTADGLVWQEITCGVQTNVAHNSLLGIEGAGTLHVSAADTNLIKTALQTESDTLQTVVTRGGTATGTITVADVNITGSSTVYDPTTIVYPTLKTLLDYPNIGPTRSQYHESDGMDEPTLSDCNILYLGATTSGVVREIFFTPTFGFYEGNPYDFQFDGTMFSNVYFRIWVDAGNIADLSVAPSTNLAIDIPFAALAGSYAKQTNTDVRIEFPMFESQFFGTSDMSMSWRIPVPFTNGILVQIGTLTNGLWSPRMALYNTATYEIGSLPSGRIGRMRVKSKNYHGKLVENGNTPNLITEENGYGVVVMGLYSTTIMVTNTPMAIEDNWKFTDGSGAVTMYSGTEDIFGAVGVWGCNRIRDKHNNHSAAFLNIDYKKNHLFEVGAGISVAFSMVDRPVYWRNGVHVTKESEPLYYDATTNSWIDNTFIYYQEVGQ
jgi:hypothetical protein